MIDNEFDQEVKYKLFRTVKEILHPSISKKNISDYKIILGEEYLPVRVYYPKKVSEMNRVIIYIRGNGNVTECNGKYSDICKKLCLNTDSLVIAIEYTEEKYQYKKMVEMIAETVAYLYHGLEINMMDPSNICLVGDSTGCHIITTIHALQAGKIKIQKEILFYPTISLEYFGKTNYESIEKNKNFNLHLIENLQEYFTFMIPKKELEEDIYHPLRQVRTEIPNTLIITGNVDCLKDEAKDYYERLPKEKAKYVELPFCAHGFLKTEDKELDQEIYEEVKAFLG